MFKLHYFCFQQNRETNENQEIGTELFRTLRTHLWFRTYADHCLCMYCCAILLKADGLSALQVGVQTEMTAQTVGSWNKCFESQGIQRLYIRFG